MSVEVETVGNRELIKQYADIIFLGCEFELMDNQEAIFKSIEYKSSTEKKSKMKQDQSFMSCCQKNQKTKIPDDLNYNIMPASEKCVLDMLLPLAARKVLNIDIPWCF